MTARRSRGEGGVHWDESRQRWIATAAIGFDGRGKRITRKASGTTKTAAKAKLREILRDHEDGTTVAPGHYTVRETVQDWLFYGVSGLAPATVKNYTTIAEQHIVGPLGAHKLRDLSAYDVDRWLNTESRSVSTRTLRLMHSILNRAVTHAMARDKVKRNVVSVCSPPAGRPGRRSKSLDLAQAGALLDAAESSPLHAYIVLSLLTGARTEELRALRWEDVDLVGQPEASPPIPASIAVVRSVRIGGDTKTRKSRRRLGMPHRCVTALRRQAARHTPAPDPGQLVFATRSGSEMDAHNVRRAFRRVVTSAGLDATAWTPREMRHSFVSLLSDSGMPLEHISRLVGHSGTAITEAVYRQQLRPVLDHGATAMNDIFPIGEE
ncbi:tyrosine recombinase XerC [Pseudonocardia sp. KRD291]|uniref:site-specific integrase n=1 Tax=Pseudonocardia sp. KRD291 TaxID=2792007 RepID=UPI001C4A2EDF|nr:site-specific integrase [Pseudonocardia sp. KRD291]MBW0101397.1 site-specific integrase [Pseudonocardia sp. KRD291]